MSGVSKRPIVVINKRKIKPEPTSEIKPVKQKVIYYVKEKPAIQKHRYNIRTILQYSNATPIDAGNAGTGFACGFCTESFHKPGDLKTHTIDEHNQDKPNYKQIKKPLPALAVKLDITGLHCNICKTELDTIEELMDHLNQSHDKRLHTDIKNQILCFKLDGDSFKCMFCQVEFITFRALQVHVNQHYRNFVCEICAAGFVNYAMFDKHTKRHITGEFKCRSCDKNFETKSKLLWHERLHATNSSEFNCIQCGEKFETKKLRKDHMTAVHGAKYEYKCPSCDKHFNNTVALWMHKRRDHLLQRRFECDHCDMRFFSKAERDNHKSIHTGSREFLCEICCKAFRLKNTLRQHMRTHSNDIPGRSIVVNAPKNDRPARC